MSTIDMTVVSGSLQTLIDVRLDAIDRALLGRVSRQERLNVVGEVEGRIHELLADRCGPGVEPARDDVLAVLARLDPPEAYLAEGFAPDEQPRPAARHIRYNPVPAPIPATAFKPARFALFGGVLALTSLAMIPLTLISYYVSMRIENEFLIVLALFGGGVSMVVGGVVSVVLAVMSRMANGWAVVGLAAGALSLLIGMAGLGFLLIDIL